MEEQESSLVTVASPALVINVLSLLVSPALLPRSLSAHGFHRHHLVVKRPAACVKDPELPVNVVCSIVCYVLLLGHTFSWYKYPWVPICLHH